MATALPLENENRIVNAILEVIRLQNLNVKQKIQQALKQEIEEEQKAISNPSTADIVPYTLDELYGILKDDGQPYETKRDEYLKKYTIISEANWTKAINDIHFSDLEDSYQYQTALSAGCDVLLTLNVRDFKQVMENSPLLILTPATFIERFCKPAL